MRKPLVFGAAICGLTAAVFAPPAISGGLRLLRLATGFTETRAFSSDYTPRHKGGIDLATGLYSRENDDLFVPGTPALVLRRTYLSGDSVSRAFGIGATHPGEEYLIGDGQQFQWASLILASGRRIEFRRTSPGTSLINAMYVHHGPSKEWHGAELGWTGESWSIRRPDRSLSIYRGCDEGSVCSILEHRDAAEQWVYYDRDTRGRLVKMHDGEGRAITFEYDEQGRISRASTSTDRDVRYVYDTRGRLASATSSDGVVRKYTYTDRHELATIEEPGTSIENVYEEQRCVRQVNRYPEGDSLTFTFEYHLENERVVRTDMTRSDGIWSQYTWNANRHATSESHGSPGAEPAVFTYERDPATQAVTGLTLTCPDRQGRPLRHTSHVRPGAEERIKQNLLETHCHWRRSRR